MISSFTGSDFKFYELDNIVDSLYSDSVIDPTSSTYQLHPESKLPAIFVKDKKLKPLLMEQWWKQAFGKRGSKDTHRA